MEELAIHLAGVEQRAKSNTHRIEDLERDQAILTRLTTSVEVMAKEQQYMRKNVDSLGKKLDDIERLPAKRWNALVDKAILVLASALITYLLTRLGL